jgi:hypothetical protein
LVGSAVGGGGVSTGGLLFARDHGVAGAGRRRPPPEWKWQPVPEGYPRQCRSAFRVAY